VSTILPDATDQNFMSHFSALEDLKRKKKKRKREDDTDDDAGTFTLTVDCA